MESKLRLLQRIQLCLFCTFLGLYFHDLSHRRFTKYFILLYLSSVYWYTNLMIDGLFCFVFPSGLNIGEFKKFPLGVGELKVIYLLDLQLFVLRESNSFFYSLLLMSESL